MSKNKMMLIGGLLACIVIGGFLFVQDSKWKNGGAQQAAEYNELKKEQAKINEEVERRKREERLQRDKEQQERKRKREERQQQQQQRQQQQQNNANSSNTDPNAALKPPDGVQPRSIREIKANARSFEGQEVIVGPLFVDSNHLDRNVISAYIARSINLTKTFPVEYDSSEGLYIFYGSLPDEQRNQMIELSEKKVNIFFVQGIFKVDSVGTQGIIAQNVWIQGQFEKKKK